jgi:hypothetical protein
METIEVTASFDTQGQITPLRFNWKGRGYLVESTGRRWTTADGQHILVMATDGRTPGGRMFELLFVSAEGRWYLEQVGPERTVA